MTAPNTTGKSNTGDLILGRGTIYVCDIGGSGGTTKGKAWRDLGNATAFSCNISTQKLEHKSSRSGLAVIDKSVVTEQKAEIKFTLDEINAENAALFFSGAKATHTNVAIAGFSEYAMITSVTKGRWYDIVNSSGERAYDVAAGDLTVEKSGSPDTALVLNTDYELDSKMGRIFILSTGVVLADGDQVDVTLAAAAGAKPVTEVRGQTQTSTLVAVKFIGENPANNDKQFEFQAHQVQLASDGDFAMIGEQFATLGFSGVLESNETEDADAPYFRTRTHDDS